MSNSKKSKTEQRFADSQKKEKQFLAEKQKSAKVKSEARAKLKSLRLAKEADDLKDSAA